MVAMLIACDGVYGRLDVHEARAARGGGPLAVVCDSIEHMTRPADVARIASTARWLGVDSWARGDVVEQGTQVEIAGCLFQRARSVS